MVAFKVRLFSCLLGLALIAGGGTVLAEDMPLPPSVAKDLATGASPGPVAANAAKTKAVKRGKRGAKTGKAKVQGEIETDKSAAENMNTGDETPSAMPTLSPSGGAGLNFRF
jgi:hypothetical protein